MHLQNQNFLHQNYSKKGVVQDHDKHCMDNHLLKKYLNHSHLNQKGKHSPIHDLIDNGYIELVTETYSLSESISVIIPIISFELFRTTT